MAVLRPMITGFPFRQSGFSRQFGLRFDCSDSHCATSIGNRNSHRSETGHFPGCLRFGIELISHIRNGIVDDHKGRSIPSRQWTDRRQSHVTARSAFRIAICRRCRLMCNAIAISQRLSGLGNRLGGIGSALDGLSGNSFLC